MLYKRVLIIGMISRMKILYHWFILISVIVGIGVFACVPINISSDEEPTPSIATEIALSSPQISPTITAISNDVEHAVIPEGMTVLFWHPWSGEMANLMAEMADEFNLSNEWGITIKVEFHSDEVVFIEDMNQTIAEGNPPDLIAAPGYYLRSLEANGFYLQDLQKFIESQNWGLSDDEVKSFLPIFWNAILQTNKRIGIPAYQSGQLIFFNQSWAKELGFSEPLSKPEDFKKYTCEAGSRYLNDSDLSNNGTGGWVYTYNPNSFFSWLIAFGGGYGSDLKDSNNLGSFENVESGTYLYDLFIDNCAWIGRQQQPYEYFANRQSLAYSGRMEDILIQERVNELNKSADQWSVIPYPSVREKPVLLVDGASYAIKTQDPERALAAWLFIRWLLTPENQVRIIEESGTFPLSDKAIELLMDYKKAHPVWAEALNYLPLVQKVPEDANWGLTKEVLADLSWKLIQFNTKREDIPVIFQEAQNLLSEITR